MSQASPEITPEVRAFIERHRVGRLATADGQGAPHVIPVTYAFDGTFLYSALDLKPKRVAGRRLKRVRNILENPRVALVIDDYSEDWDQLAYVLVRGRADILEEGDEQRRAEDLLRRKYPQYEEMLEPGATVLMVTPERVISWGRL